MGIKNCTDILALRAQRVNEKVISLVTLLKLCKQDVDELCASKDRKPYSLLSGPDNLKSIL